MAKERKTDLLIEKAHPEDHSKVDCKAEKVNKGGDIGREVSSSSCCSSNCKPYSCKAHLQCDQATFQLDSKQH